MYKLQSSAYLKTLEEFLNLYHLIIYFQNLVSKIDDKNLDKVAYYSELNSWCKEIESKRYISLQKVTLEVRENMIYLQPEQIEGYKRFLSKFLWNYEDFIFDSLFKSFKYREDADEVRYNKSCPFKTGEEFLDYLHFLISEFQVNWRDLYNNIHEEIDSELSFFKHDNKSLSDLDSDLEQESLGLNKNKSVSNKAKILVLKQLGLFDLPIFESITLEKKGNFLSQLMNMSFENAKDYLGNIHDIKRANGNKSPYNSNSIKQANDLLSLIDLPPIL